ncbi:hypothetical protein EJD97_008824 [Solanum chilense]|uniref:Uncharacterized protein n=1 Tax=Solanum chilense TaxID=4083 RepID=A0A6N2ANR9_SOLCI|nr:hypothetical protein EJD97_008824 [Solanum chilense]
MNTRRNAARRLDKEIFNAEAHPRGNEVPPFEEDVNNDQAPVCPPPLMDGDIRAAFLQMAQAITTQDKHVGTMSSHLRDFTRMNPLTFWV